MVSEYLILMKIFISKKIPRKNKVYIAGNILKAATKSPENKKTAARCMPQPKHSIPRIFLFTQGII
jgi:hypothetical protein